MIYPKISVITPSYNQGQFLEETILSVIGQDYPNLEYIIIDGGSSDNSVEIIKSYENKISYWISEKDKGQSNAINKGFRKATGNILCWLNSDDLYMPGCLKYIAKKFVDEGEGVLFGNCLHFGESAEGLTASGSDVFNLSRKTSLNNRDFIIQPSAFWSRKVWEMTGPLRENMHFAFDWEWFLRAERKGIKFFSLSKCLSMYRNHGEHKTGTGGRKRQMEILDLYKEYSPRYAELYEMLMNEKELPLNFKTRVKKKFFRSLYIEPQKPQCFKQLLPKKYKDYSQNEIEGCYSML